jgi:hypothetical protein
VDHSLIAPIPFEWWFLPVMMQVRVGEHNPVVWKFV